jgi:hypothetical protein
MAPKNYVCSANRAFDGATTELTIGAEASNPIGSAAAYNQYQSDIQK